jgi:phosphate/sulfate permease
MVTKTESMMVVFLLVCFAFGIFLGCIGLGIGLIFFTVQQAFGISILTFGVGAFFGAAFGGRRVLKAIAQTFIDMEQLKTK